MLKLNELKLSNGLVLLNIEEPKIDTHIGSVKKTEDLINQERGKIRFRIATIVAKGDLDSGLLASLSLEGNNDNLTEIYPVGAKVIVPIDACERFDIPVEGHPSLGFMKADYIYSEYQEEEFVPIAMQE